MPLNLAEEKSQLCLAFFNNKGGVGKTTLACNFAHFAQSSLGLKVCLMDLDPQANATQLLLNDEQWESMYSDFDSSRGRSIYKAFVPFMEGEATADVNLEIQTSERFGIEVIPGHPSLSRVEDNLSRSWMDFQGHNPGGGRRTGWLATLRESLEADLVVLDLGPSLGALNRSALIGATHLVTPVAADLFSLYALENIGTWVAEWIKDYTSARKGTIEKYQNTQVATLPEVPLIARGYAGYTVQQYVTKKAGGELRATKAYDRYRDQIPARAMALADASALPLEELALGVVPNMFSMVPLAQSVHAPIAQLTTTDGVRGAQIYQQQRYAENLAEIFAEIARNIGAGS